MEPLRERFATHMLGGASADEALRRTLDEAAAEMAQTARSGGAPLEALARALGLHRLIEKGLDALLDFALTRWMHVPLSMLPIGGKIPDLPRPECVEAHLPADRVPTREDYLRAWALCTGEAPP
jgi:hypothetical protein